MSDLLNSLGAALNPQDKSVVVPARVYKDDLAAQMEALSNAIDDDGRTSPDLKDLADFLEEIYLKVEGMEK